MNTMEILTAVKAAKTNANNKANTETAMKSSMERMANKCENRVSLDELLASFNDGNFNKK